MRPEIQQIIDILNLKPHQLEGGYFCETYRASEKIPAGLLKDSKATSFSTAIYYLLTEDTFSHLHSLCHDEVFHFYLGDPVEMLNLYEDGSGETITLGIDILNGHKPQHVVTRDIWQGCRLAPGGTFALLGTTVSPGFEFADYVHADKEEMLRKYPQFKEKIERLCK